MMAEQQHVDDTDEVRMLAPGMDEAAVAENTAAHAAYRAQSNHAVNVTTADGGEERLRDEP